MGQKHEITPFQALKIYQSTSDALNFLLDGYSFNFDLVSLSFLLSMIQSAYYWIYF